MSDTGGNGLLGLGDLFAMFGTANPLTSISKTIEQFKRGVNDFLVAVENFNSTMQTLNGVAVRISILMDDVEDPIRALMPQVTRSIKAADMMITQISGPIEMVAPGIARLAETLGSPVFATMPNEIADFLDTLGDLAGRLQPLTQMAENAGSLFGFRSPLSALREAAGRAAQPAAVVTPPPPPPPPPIARTPVTAKKVAAKKTPARKTTATKTAAKTTAAATTARKTAAKNAAVRQPDVTKAPAEKAAKKAAAKKAPAKRTSSRS